MFKNCPIPFFQYQSSLVPFDPQKRLFPAISSIFINGKAKYTGFNLIDTTLTLLNALQSMSAEHPVGFAVIVILMMVTEGLLLVGLISILLKILFRPNNRIS